jgi:hypothetical protein
MTFQRFEKNDFNICQIVLKKISNKGNTYKYQRNGCGSAYRGPQASTASLLIVCEMKI